MLAALLPVHGLPVRQSMKIPRRALIVVLLLLAALAWRLPNLGKTLDDDEFWTFRATQASWGQMIDDLVAQDSHPPLYYFLLKAWGRIDSGEAWARFLNVLAGVVALLVVYRIACRVQREKSALTTLGLAAILPQAVWNSQYLRSYMLAGLFSVLGIYAAGRFFEEPDRRRLWKWAALFVLGATVSLYSFYFSGLLLAAVGVYGIWKAGRSGKLKWWIACQAATLLLFAPWVPYLIRQLPVFINHPQMTARAGFYLGGVHRGGIARGALGILGLDQDLFAELPLHEVFSSAVLAAATLLAVVLLAVIAWRGYRELAREDGGREWAPLLAVCLVGPFLLALAAHEGLGIVLTSRYFLASSLIMPILFAGFVWSLKGPWAAGALVLLTVFFIFRDQAVVRYEIVDFKGAAAFTRANVIAGGVVIVPDDRRFSDYMQREKAFPGDQVFIRAKEFIEDPRRIERESGKVLLFEIDKLENHQLNDLVSRKLAEAKLKVVIAGKFGIMRAFVLEGGAGSR
ncbi:MAG: glycosyltransferase family 39 protein [Candidatus Tectomicrobia bacterium]|uniref:Glycosyltransferase family 39 protein n=1 Tax=Tectimicrobiota bacterium TaxID=2528274 RepID=A0A932M1U4_UNCTE|nr:glycosyltransferase family 39 protein [Candidatus Tectomicrobia bacterium]